MKIFIYLLIYIAVAKFASYCTYDICIVHIIDNVSRLVTRLLVDVKTFIKIATIPPFAINFI